MLESRWRDRARQRSWLRGFLPAVRTDERNEAARLEHGGTKGITAALDQLQILVFNAAHRHNHSAGFGKLREQRHGYGGRCCRDENGVEGRKIGQAERTITAMHVN